MAGGGPGVSPPLLTVLVSARAWREAAAGSRDNLQLQLSVEPETPGDFRLTVRNPARGPNNVVGDYRLRDVSYEVRSSCCHQLSLLADPSSSITFNFDDEREAQKWWTVLSSSIREAQKAAQSQAGGSGVKPPLCSKPHLTPDVSASSPFPLEAEPSATASADLATKEELAARLSRCIESGDQTLAARYAAELASHRVPTYLQLRPTCYPTTQICMKVGVEDAKASVNISTYVYSHTTIAMLKQQIFRDYQFHPSIQRWIIAQCLCSDDRTVGSYGIRRDGDTAFLYLLGAKQPGPPDQNQHLPPDQHRAHTLPNRPPPRPVLNPKPEMMDLNGHMKPGHPAPPSPVQIGWSCPVCTYINVPTRPGCEMCSSDRPAEYVVPEGYRPGESERRRIQQENDGLQQYKKEKGRREDVSNPRPPDSSLDDYIIISA